MDLKPLFDLYLRTTNKLEVVVRKVNGKQYAIRLSQMPLTLPLEVVSATGTRRMMVSDKEVIVESASRPVIDPNVYYLTNVRYE